MASWVEDGCARPCKMLGPKPLTSVRALFRAYSFIWMFTVTTRGLEFRIAVSGLGFWFSDSSSWLQRRMLQALHEGFLLWSVGSEGLEIGF